MAAWYKKTFNMTPEQIEEVLATFGRKGETLPKNVNLDRVRDIIKNYLTTDYKVTQIGLAQKYGTSREGIREHIARIATACQKVCGKELI